MQRHANVVKKMINLTCIVFISGIFTDEMILILLHEVRRYIYSKVLIISDVSIHLTSFYVVDSKK